MAKARSSASPQRHFPPEVKVSPGLRLGSLTLSWDWSRHKLLGRCPVGTAGPASIEAFPPHVVQVQPVRFPKSPLVPTLSQPPSLLTPSIAAYPAPATFRPGVVWEYVVGGDCEGDEPPVVAGHTSRHTNVSEYERSGEQAHSGNHSWKITVAPGASDSASVFIGFNVAYADLLPLTQIIFSAWVYVPASDLLLSDVELELMCGEVDSEGATTWENTRSENPAAYDSWEYLEAATTISAACQDIRLALRVTDRSAPHVLYWDDISFRSE